MANEDYILHGTERTVNGEAGADAAFSVEGLADSTGRVSAQIDLGVSPRPYIFTWSAECQWQATPDQYGRLKFYIATAPDGDATQIDGDVGSSDAALGDVDMLRNLRYIGDIVSENAAANEVCVASGEFVCMQRYISIVAFNDGGAAINATDSNFRFDLHEKSRQSQ